MSKIEQLSFMPASVKALKTMLKGIMGSYDNPWDLLAELSQNSIDALRKSDSDEGNVEFFFNKDSAEIHIKDNGTGINPVGAADLFSPFGTNKEDDFDSVGEKGVGLKYVIFSTRKFTLESFHREGSFKVVVVGAAEWLRSNSIEDFPGGTISRIDNPDAKTGTEIRLELDDPNHPLLDLSLVQLKTLLLTKTAIGSTKPIWDENFVEKFDCLIRIKDSSKKEKREKFSCKFLLPTDVLTKKVSIEEHDAWRMDRNPSDTQKRNYLKNKIIYDQGVYNGGGRDIRYWSCIMPSSDQWFKASNKLGIVSSSDEDDYSEETHFFGFHPDVCLSTKGMPTTVSLEFHPRGDAGYKIQFFSIIEDDNLSFDIGRKGASVGPSTIAMYKRITQKQFSKMLTFKRFLRGDAGEKIDRFAERDLFNEIDGLPNLEDSESKFLKRPNKQEATVAAIFYEMLGRDKFDPFKPLISGYRDVYDLTGQIDGRNIIIEFKYELSALFKDFHSLTKMFSDIHVVVIWELTEPDRKRIKDKNILLTALDEDDRRLFPCTTYIMESDHARSIEILEIKRLIGAK